MSAPKVEVIYINPKQYIVKQLFGDWRVGRAFSGQQIGKHEA